jgi:hypothetical protein
MVAYHRANQRESVTQIAVYVCGAVIFIAILAIDTVNGHAAERDWVFKGLIDDKTHRNLVRKLNHRILRQLTGG